MLTANTWGDPNSKVIFQTLVVSDCFFSFLYVSLNHYIFPSGHWAFCFFPKLFFLICFYFWFDDRLLYIL